MRVKSKQVVIRLPGDVTDFYKEVARLSGVPMGKVLCVAVAISLVRDQRRLAKAVRPKLPHKKA